MPPRRAGIEARDRTQQPKKGIMKLSTIYKIDTAARRLAILAGLVFVVALFAGRLARLI